jgi:hypothetical protein
MNTDFTQSPSTASMFFVGAMKPKAKAHAPLPNVANVNSELNAKLLAIAGSEVVQPYSDEEMVLLVAQGTLVKSSITVSRGLPHRCHFNAAVRWLKNPKAIIFFGYQNCGDIWTQHSWNVCDGQILDTDDRKLYYGVAPANPDLFAMQVIFQETGHALDRMQKILGKRAFARFRQICARMLLRKNEWPGS